MLKRTFSLCLSGAMCMGLLSARVLAQDKEDDQEGQSPDQAMMEAYMKASQPGEFHKNLDYFEGKWNLKVKDMSSGPEAIVTMGTATFKWILGNRFMVQEVAGTMMGMPFEGHGMTGYDNARKQYTDVWCDNFGTGFLISHGTCDPSGKTFTYAGEYKDPISGEMSKTKQVVKIINDKTFTFTMSGPGEDGNETTMMEITYERS